MTEFSFLARAINLSFMQTKWFIHVGRYLQKIGESRKFWPTYLEIGVIVKLVKSCTIVYVNNQFNLMLIIHVVNLAFSTLC